MSDVSDTSIHQQISALVAREHELRERAARGEISTEEEQRQLRVAEEALDQAWDLLRVREGRRHAGLDPDGATPRSTDTVERYEQ